MGKHDSKCLDFLEQTVGRHLDTLGDSGESSEGSEEHGREICTFRDYIHVVTSTMSSEIQTLKALLVSIQKEMKNMLLENDGQSIFVRQTQKIWPNRVL